MRGHDAHSRKKLREIALCLMVQKRVFFLSSMQCSLLATYAPILTIFETKDINRCLHVYTSEKYLNICTGGFPGHLFNALFSTTASNGTKKVNCSGERDDGWQWHQLDHIQIICTTLQTDNHGSTSPLSFYRPDALPATEPTVSKHRR